MTIAEEIRRLISEVETLANAAMPGPWWAGDQELHCPTLEGVRERFGHVERNVEAVMMAHPPFAFGGLCAITFSETAGVGHSLKNRDFIAAARTNVPRLIAALRVALKPLQDADDDRTLDAVRAALKGELGQSPEVSV